MSSKEDKLSKFKKLKKGGNFKTKVKRNFEKILNSNCLPSTSNNIGPFRADNCDSLPKLVIDESEVEINKVNEKQCQLLVPCKTMDIEELFDGNNPSETLNELNDDDKMELELTYGN